MLIQKPKGTYDLLPGKAFQRSYLENKLRQAFSNFNYKEIRTPTFEKTVLFKRGIGEETDIVSKEMYSFNENEFTLKPEMTAPVIRAYLENSLYNESPLQKLFYICNNFRRERPQAGRYREFSQFGAEAIGSSDYLMDVEILLLADMILKDLRVDDAVLKINTIGSLDERKAYIIELKNYLAGYLNLLSPDSKIRFERNPLRILDSKVPADIKILEDAPLLYEHLQENTRVCFQNILAALDAFNVKYEIDYKLVRGFDYYTSTTFEFISDALGSQNTLIGGGRYDLLVEQLGGKPTPAIGFAAGIERLMMVLENKKSKLPEEKKLKLYIATINDESRLWALKLLDQLRLDNIKCETDFLKRSIKSQMKEADKLGAEYVLVLGEEEIKSNSGKLRKMSDSTEVNIPSINNLKNLLRHEN